MTARRTAPWLGALLGAVTAGAALAQGLEPPPEAGEGDYEIERADSLAADDVEVELGASGRSGSATRRTRRLRFQGDGLGGSVRDGAGDPLSGTVFDANTAGGRASVGTVAPRWGAGLLLGAASDPWSFRAEDRGTTSRFRGRAGEGVRFERPGPLALEALGGRFARRGLAGARLAAGRGALGVLAARGGAQSSLAFEGEDVALETALGAAGGWRAEARVRRSAAGGALWLRARGGHESFASLAEPRRSGPARVLSAAFDREHASAALAVYGALWRWRQGVDGARGGLELRMRLAHDGALALGFEEQRGARRWPAAAAALARAGRPRQGLWGAWRGEADGFRLELHHESWGDRLARHAVRTVSAARFESSPFAGVTLAVAHAAWRVKRGESLYLAETQGSRLVLRALTGRGAQTRLEAGLPAGGGRLRASLHLTAEHLRPRPQWTLEWTRRTRTASGKRAPGMR